MASIGRYGKGAITLYGKNSLLSLFEFGGLRQDTARLNTELPATCFALRAVKNVEQRGQGKMLLFFNRKREAVVDNQKAYPALDVNGRAARSRLADIQPIFNQGIRLEAPSHPDVKSSRSKIYVSQGSSKS